MLILNTATSPINIYCPFLFSPPILTGVCRLFRSTQPVPSSCFCVLQFKAAITVYSSWCWDMFPWDKPNNLVWKLLWNQKMKQFNSMAFCTMQVKRTTVSVIITCQTEKAKLMSGALTRVSSSSISTAKDQIKTKSSKCNGEKCM